MTRKESIDWPEIHRRVDTLRTAIEQGFAPSPGQERQILKTRAQELAREPEAAVPAGKTLEAVEFDLASERHAFPLAQVSEVALLRELTPVPCTPAFVLGIINVRGVIRTVIDLKVFFDLPAAGITELNRIILIEHGGMQVGVLADAIRGVRRIPAGDLQPALPTLTAIRAEYLLGITGDRLVVLDAVKILTDKSILVDEEAPS